MSSGKKKHRKKVRNKSKDWLMDYYNTGRRFDEENRRRQEAEGNQPRGLRNLNSFEWGCIVVIVLGGIGLIVRYVIL
jgi:cytoskeletal protein RodZ